MATVPTPPVFANLPQFQFQQPSAGGWSHADIANLLSTPTGSMTNTVIPSMANILGQQSQYIQPQIEAVRARGEELAAGQQSDAMKRGLTGSDIEAAGMLGARQGAATEEAQLRGQVGMQQAQSLAAALMQAYGFDIQQNRSMFEQLAQLIGQEISAQREMEMFQKTLDFQRQAAEGSAKSGLWSAGIGALGTVGGAALGAYLGNPMLGAQLGGAAGSAGGASIEKSKKQ